MPIDDYPGDAPDATEAGTGKFIKLIVPNFNAKSATAPTGEGLTSYLRIGAVEDAATAGKYRSTPGIIDHSGEDLASLVTTFADDSRLRTPIDKLEAGNTTSSIDTPGALLPPSEELPLNTTAVPPTSKNTAIETADHKPSPITGQLPGTLDNRVAETSVLHTKGGWRDHSDGNRITTTRGDKVEVIQGNYKMVVLGRQYDSKGQPDLANAAGWDLSGGLVDNLDLGNGPPPGANAAVSSMTYVWEQDSAGNWGWTQTTQLGAEDATDNGKLIGLTFAHQISQTYGSATKPVDSFATTTYANALTNATVVAGDMTETFDLGGSHSISEHSHSHDEYTYTRHHYSELKMAPLYMSDISAAGLMMSEIDLAGLMISEIKAAPLIPEVKLGIHLDTHLGLHLDVHLGLHSEMHVGPHTQVKAMCADSTELDLKNTTFSNWMATMVNLGSGPPAPPPPAGAAAATAAGAAAAASGNLASQAGAAISTGTDLATAGGAAASSAGAATSVPGAGVGAATSAAGASASQAANVPSGAPTPGSDQLPAPGESAPGPATSGGWQPSAPSK